MSYDLDQFASRLSAFAMAANADMDALGRMVRNFREAHPEHADDAMPRFAASTPTALKQFWADATGTADNDGTTLIITPTVPTTDGEIVHTPLHQSDTDTDTDTDTADAVPTQDWSGYTVTFDATSWPEDCAALDEVEVRSDQVNVDVELEIQGNYVSLNLDVDTDEFEDDLRYRSVAIGLNADNLLDLLVRAFNEDYEYDEDKRPDAHAALCAELLRRLNA